MTHWHAPHVALYVRDAGFIHPDETTAIAIALATSRGHDDYHRTVAGGLVADYRGLFGIDVVAHPAYADYDLFSPRVSADVAKELTDAHDGFGWSACYRLGTYEPFVVDAGIARSIHVYEQRQTLPFPLTEASRYAQAQRDAAIRRVTHVPLIHHRKAKTWPRTTES